MRKVARSCKGEQKATASPNVSLGQRGDGEDAQQPWDKASVAGSARSSGTKRSAGAMSPAAQAMKNVADLDVNLALSGQELKQALYHSRRWLHAAGEEGETDTPEYVTLSAQVDLIKNCIQLWVLLGGNGTAERAKLMEEVMRCTQSLPAAFCERHLTAMVKEETLKTDASVQHWLGMVTPDIRGVQCCVERKQVQK